MMDWTDRHFRFFHRLLSRRARLYTEMLAARAVLHGERDRLLRFDAAEHPVTRSRQLLPITSRSNYLSRPRHRSRRFHVD
jgi:tRNA-dihydrouridine synthase